MTSHTSTERTRPRVVVVGAGFGGMATVNALRWADVDVLLIDRNGYNTFQPLLYQVATGGLNPGDVTYALRAFTAKQRNARFRQGTVVGIDTASKHVRLDDGDEIGYDYLVVATGVTANFFGIPGAAENSLLIYTRREALETRDHIFRGLERLATEEGKDGSANVVVVGGGATGVEMAGTLAEMVSGALPVSYPELDNTKIKVILVEMAPRRPHPVQEVAALVLRPRAAPSRRRAEARGRRRRGDTGRGAAQGRHRDPHPHGHLGHGRHRAPGGVHLGAAAGTRRAHRDRAGHAGQGLRRRLRDR